MPFNSYTTNEAKQYGQSGNALVDFLSKAAAQRSSVLSGTDNLIELFVKAYNLDKETSLKLLHWLRDPRSGAGEKAAYNKIVDYLYNVIPSAIMNNLDAVVKYGSYKTLMSLAKKTNESDYNTIIKKFAKDIKSKDRLANKWAPRLHSADDKMAKDIKDVLGMTNSQYRKWTKTYSQTIEQLMAQGLWSDIDYSKVPSVAMKKYRKAFMEHDKDRFEAWKNDLQSKANSSVLYPHDVIKMLDLSPVYGRKRISSTDEQLAEKLWKNLPNYLSENASIMTMIDLSGSMSGCSLGKDLSPMIVAISLGLYISERMTGQFKNSYISFSDSPQMVRFADGMSLTDRINHMFKSDWGYSTNFGAAYKMLLSYAVQNNISQEDMPEMIIALSDMQFNSADRSGSTHLDRMRELFKSAGYKMPKLVFWNLNESFTGSPARYNHKDVALVSGFSPSILKSVLKNDTFDPVQIVYETVEYIDDLDFSGIPDQILYNKALATSSSIM